MHIITANVTNLNAFFGSICKICIIIHYMENVKIQSKKMCLQLRAFFYKD